MRTGLFSEKTFLNIILISLCGIYLVSHLATAEENRQNASWESLGPEGGWILALAQHPTESNILYAAPYGFPCRLQKSTDKGNTWTEVSQVYGYIESLAIDPNNPSTIFGFYYNRVNKSTNGGAAWNENRFDGHYFYGGTVDPNDSNILHAYGRHDDGSEWRTCYFRSTDGGTSWSAHYLFSTVSYSHSYAVASDPTNSAVVYVTGYYRADNEYHGFIYRSTDGGESWMNKSYGTDGYIYDIVTDPTSGKLYVASGSGIYRSTNRGDHWDKNNGWASGYKLTINPNNPDMIFAGDYDRCFRSTDGGVNWNVYTTGLSGGECTNIIADNGDVNNVFYANATGFFKSTDGGVTWFPSNSGLLIANITALKLVPTVPTTMYIAFDNNAVYKTTNAMGKSHIPSAVIWNRLPEFYACHNIAAFAIPHDNPDYVYAMEGGG